MPPALEKLPDLWAEFVALAASTWYWWALFIAFWAVMVILRPDNCSDVHAITIVALSIMSLGQLIEEAPRHIYSNCYFIATGFQMIHRRDWLKVVHHAIAVVAGGVGLVELEGHWLAERMSSKVMLIEASTPLLHAYKRSGSKTIGLLFSLSFIALRTFYLGYIARGVWNVGWAGRLVLGQWCLNQIWSIQIVQKVLLPSSKKAAGGKSSD